LSLVDPSDIIYTIELNSPLWTMKTLDIDECAEFLKVDRKTALRLAGEGKLPGAKVGRAWVFLEDDLAEHLRAQVRIQMRQRQVEAEVGMGLEAAAAHTPSILPPSRPGRKRRELPNLDQYNIKLPGSGAQLSTQ
jgi:excisionase family DNA binding protein